MLFALAVLLLVLAVAGGVAIHPLLFLLALLAVVRCSSVAGAAPCRKAADSQARRRVRHGL